MATRLRSSARTSAEELLAMQLTADGRYSFTRQFPYALHRKFTADFEVWDAADPFKVGVLVEVQGGIYSRQAHGSVTGVLADIDRLNAATLAGWRMLRCTPQMVEDGTALALIESALGVAK